MNYQQLFVTEIINIELVEDFHYISIDSFYHSVISVGSII